MLKFLEKYPLPDFSESSGASKCGLCADGRNGGTVAWNFQYFCCKTGNFAGKGTAAFYEYLCSLAGKLRWSTWIGGTGNLADSGILCF